MPVTLVKPVTPVTQVIIVIVAIPVTLVIQAILVIPVTQVIPVTPVNLVILVIPVTPVILVNLNHPINLSQCYSDPGHPGYPYHATYCFLLFSHYSVTCHSLLRHSV